MNIHVIVIAASALLTGCVGNNSVSSAASSVPAVQSSLFSSSSASSSLTVASVSSAEQSSSASSLSIDYASATLIPDPSWSCRADNGLPPPANGRLVFSATLQLGATHEFGETQFGNRRLLDVNGASFSGDRIQGTFLSGGLELELVLSNGAMELEEINILRTHDGALIYMRTCGFMPAGESEARFVPDFEVSNNSAYAWLNTGKFAGTRRVNELTGTVEVAIYDIANVPLSEPRVQLKDPAGVINQPWECAVGSGNKGQSVFTENVTLGNSVAIGASKYGTRNIIPITGGTVNGRFNGSVLSGGADYQLIGAKTVLDARYTLKSNDGEYVLVRNCGAFGALIPLFEARKNGPYAYLNQNKYISSDPGVGAGGVSITFYERN